VPAGTVTISTSSVRGVGAAGVAVANWVR